MTEMKYLIGMIAFIIVIDLMYSINPNLAGLVAMIIVMYAIHDTWN